MGGLWFDRVGPIKEKAPEQLSNSIIIVIIRCNYYFYYFYNLYSVKAFERYYRSLENKSD